MERGNYASENIKHDQYLCNDSVCWDLPNRNEEVPMLQSVRL